MIPARHDLGFVGAATLLFAACTAATIVWCESMSAMDGMRMAGGWTMSMAWMRMPGQTWAATAASFLGMWIVMMIAMMLPSHVPILARYRQAVRVAGGARLEAVTVLVGAGYFSVWWLLGLVTFLVGLVLARLEMRFDALSRSVPLATGFVVLIAGALQFTSWKARQLGCCRQPLKRSRVLPANGAAAWRHGVWLGLRCTCCCAGPMAILLVTGVMDLAAMAVVTAAITAERWARHGEQVARVIGAAAATTGLLLIARALGW